MSQMTTVRQYVGNDITLVWYKAESCYALLTANLMDCFYVLPHLTRRLGHMDKLGCGQVDRDDTSRHLLRSIPLCTPIYVLRWTCESMVGSSLQSTVVVRKFTTWLCTGNGINEISVLITMKAPTWFKHSLIRSSTRVLWLRSFAVARLGACSFG